VRILVIRRDNIGDLVCTTPLLAGLRARYPQAHIAALVNSYNGAVLDGNPEIDAVHTYTKLKHRLPGESRFGILLGRLRMLMLLRREPFDYIVLAKAGFDRQGLIQARQLRRRHIVGFTKPGETATRLITVPVPGMDYSYTHEVEIMKRLAGAMDAHDAGGPLRVYPDSARMQAWRSRLPALGERGGRRWLAAHISAREPSRRWPAERWVELLRRLTAEERTGAVLIWAPGPADDPRHPGDDEKAAAIMAEVDGTKVLRAPTLELADLIAVLGLCDAFIGADGGAMHLAAAAGLPCVALFENLEDKKRHWHPWRVPHEMVFPATREVSDISVEQVIRASQRLLAA
jgi:ADP-heptose:LPS heptosyltransferase